MKVLFAVSNEEISESIVKKYQREYKEIISYKNVYYFNAILKEIQKDKTYDRIVISEDLEAFTNAQYSQIDKFIFEKLDGISDEASNMKGEDIPIILICSDRREKSEEMLVKLFGIGIYNALLGNDRSLENVCELLRKPRLKKEAKLYYKIDSEEVTYQSESENDVSEVEIQNILAHYKRLGKDERKYVESFDNIASQYNDVQLRIISKFLPLNVRAVLEEQSEKYQQIISFNRKVSDDLRKQDVPEQNNGTSQKLLKTKNSGPTLSEPVIIPSSVNMNSNRKLAKIKNEVTPEPVGRTVKEVGKIGPMFEEENRNKTNTVEQDDEILPGFNSIEPEVIESEDTILPGFSSIEPEKEENTLPGFDEIEKELGEMAKTQQEEQEQPKKRGRGRPRKYPVAPPLDENKPKRGRGRPRKYPVVEETETSYNKEPEIEEAILPGFDNIESEPVEETVLPGFNSVESIESEPEETTLPGFDNVEEEQSEAMLPEVEDDSMDSILPGFEYEKETNTEESSNIGFNVQNTNEYNQPYNNLSEPEIQSMNKTYEDVDISSLLTANKKVACFVGTSKNGTSFIVNNVAEIASKMGIDTAILDTTKNRNSYYIYTKNEEDLRKTAMQSVNALVQGVAKGIQVNKNLTVYTSLPEEAEGIENAGKILQTLLNKHSLVLIDCDFNTPIHYFEKTQEIYLVQSYDILTIQPLTAFLRELKSRNILKENKLRVIINKSVKVRGVNDKTIIGGIAYYNDPAMSFMTELFDKNTIKYITIPFNEEVYIKYLENIINCEISVKGYPKNILQIMSELVNMIYPAVAGRGTYTPPQVQNNGFSASMNSTLDQMRKY